MPVLVEYDDDIRLKHIGFGQVDIERSMVKHSLSLGPEIRPLSSRKQQGQVNEIVTDEFAPEDWSKVLDDARENRRGQDRG
jgi:hypothetical protein